MVECGSADCNVTFGSACLDHRVRKGYKCGRRKKLIVLESPSDTIICEETVLFNQIELFASDKMGGDFDKDVNCNGDIPRKITGSAGENSTLKENHDSNSIQGKGRYKRHEKSCVATVLMRLIEAAFSIFAWILFVCFIVVPVSPLVVIFITFKSLERFVYWHFKGVEAVCGGDSVWMSNGPENPGIISAVMIFTGEIQTEAFRERIFETMVRRNAGRIVLDPYRRSTKTVSTAFLNHLWTEEESFDINEHVRKYPKDVASKTALRHTVSQLCTLPFRKGMSQWDLVVIPWLHNGARKTAILFRMHHSVADGGSLVNYLTNVLPDTGGKPVKLKKFSQNGRLLMALKGALFSPIFVLRMMIRSADSTILHGKPLAGQKVVAWSEPMEMEIFKRIKTSTNTTLNDVLVSCVAASIRAFFINQNLEPPRDMKVSIPIDLRKNTESDAVEFENRFAVIQLALPIGISDPLELLYAVQERMNALKTSGEPFAVGPTMDMLLNIVPTCIISPFFDFIVKKCTGVLSNVPGPQRSLKVVGHDLETMTFWAPPRANLGMTFSITSYNGRIVIGVQSDKDVLEDPEEINSEFPTQVQRLIDRLNLHEEAKCM